MNRVKIERYFREYIESTGISLDRWQCVVRCFSSDSHYHHYIVRFYSSGGGDITIDNVITKHGVITSFDDPFITKDNIQ